VNRCQQAQPFPTPAGCSSKQKEEFMKSITVAMFALTGALLIGGPLQAQNANQRNREQIREAQLANLEDARAAFANATNAGAATNAVTLYEDASWRLKFAESNWSATKGNDRDAARLRAEEAYYAARAAEAKARWIGTNTMIVNLQADISRFGGSSDVHVQGEEVSLAIDRGATTSERIATAQAAIDLAKSVGADQIANNDLSVAVADLSTSRKINRAQKQSESADHLSFVAEMIARRAYYMSRLAESTRYVPDLQLNRTRLAQAVSERQAAAERQQRELAERQAADLRRQLETEAQNKQAQQAELDRLRAQVDENRRMIDARSEQDRTARTAAEQDLDRLRAQYQDAITTGSSSDVDTLRRQVEDQQIALRAIQERERSTEESMAAEVAALKTNAATDAERQAEVQRREAEITRLRSEREQDAQRRMDADKAAQQAIADAQQKRMDAEARTAQLQQQVQETQDALTASKAANQQTQSELSDTRAELRRRDMEQAFSRLAKTRTTDRGLIVTLPGIFFDTGKSTLKPGAKATLTKIATQLKKDEGARVSVEGHTDSVGGTAANEALSEKRAAAVRDFLTKGGVDGDHITSSGKGESEPVATNKTAAGRQQNRRVELVITD
jgi:outer membrane protein OmpA-like peptidoglycan-associated protein